MHDFQRSTAQALPELLRQLKDGGYKVVHMVSRSPVTTLSKYDEMLAQQDKLSVKSSRPIRVWCARSASPITSTDSLFGCLSVATSRDICSCLLVFRSHQRIPKSA